MSSPRLTSTSAAKALRARSESRSRVDSFQATMVNVGHETMGWDRRGKDEVECLGDIIEHGFNPTRSFSGLGSSRGHQLKTR
jgi:hypothetical protein